MVIDLGAAVIEELRDLATRGRSELQNSVSAVVGERAYQVPQRAAAEKPIETTERGV